MAYIYDSEEALESHQGCCSIMLPKVGSVRHLYGGHVFWETLVFTCVLLCATSVLYGSEQAVPF